MGRTIEPIPSNAPIVTPDNDAKHPAHLACMVKEVIGDHETDFLLQPFDDRVFISVSQMGKLGTIISAEEETAAGGISSFTVEVLMGKRDEVMMELCARRIIAQMVEDRCGKKLLLSMALKSHGMQYVQEIVSKIVENKVW